MTERLVPPLTYVIVTGVLLMLTVINIGSALIDLRGWNSVVNLAIAALEVVIMALVFMHLRWSSATTRLVAVAALLWMVILLAGTMDDILTRGWLSVPGK
jgi:caa(3)-type oxidase subunit IV